MKSEDFEPQKYCCKANLKNIFVSPYPILLKREGLDGWSVKKIFFST